jgi:hypothetical protein
VRDDGGELGDGGLEQPELAVAVVVVVVASVAEIVSTRGT